MKKHKLTGEGGKGSADRVKDKKSFDESWDRIFGKGKKEECSKTLQEEKK